MLLAVARREAEQVLLDQQPELSSLTSWRAWQAWRDAVVDRYRRQGRHFPLSVLMSELGRSTPAAQAVTSALITSWQREIQAGIEAMQGRGKISATVDAQQSAAALLAGIQGGVVIMLSTGRLTHLAAATRRRNRHAPPRRGAGACRSSSAYRSSRVKLPEAAGAADGGGPAGAAPGGYAPGGAAPGAGVACHDAAGALAWAAA
jgi:hypothetical protein